MTPVEVSVRTVVDLLVRQEYEALARMTGGIRMSASDIREAIKEYGRTLMPPAADTWWPTVVVTPVHSGPPTLHVAAPLWTVEEGRSDLSLELHLIEITEGLFRPHLLNIHVL